MIYVTVASVADERISRRFPSLHMGFTFKQFMENLFRPSLPWKTSSISIENFILNTLIVNLVYLSRLNRSIFLEVYFDSLCTSCEPVSKTHRLMACFVTQFSFYESRRSSFSEVCGKKPSYMSTAILTSRLYAICVRSYGTVLAERQHFQTMLWNSYGKTWFARVTSLSWMVFQRSPGTVPLRAVRWWVWIWRRTHPGSVGAR